MPFEFHLPSLEEMRTTPDGLEMLRMIDDDNFHSALITGCPGSGKTTVSIYRFVRIDSQQESVHFVTYQNMLVLAIRNLANIQGVPSQHVSTFHKWFCPLTDSAFNVASPPSPEQMDECLQDSTLADQEIMEIIIDEGQDLPLCVYQTLPQHFERLFVGADNGQQVHAGHGARVEDIEQSLRENADSFRRFALGRNFRNTYETYRFARQFISRRNQTAWDETILERLIHSNRRGPKPTIISYRNNDRRNENLQTTLQNAEGNVAILCPLGLYPRNQMNSGESVDEVYDLITDMGISATKYHSRTPVPDSLERYVVTTFKSAKGMEFDVVVIPRINFFKDIPEELYVACTRARRQLFVYRDLGNPQCDPLSGFETDTYDAESVEVPVDETNSDIPF